MAKSNLRKIFIIVDFVASGLTWSLFFIYRKIWVETVKFGIEVPFHPDLKFFAGLILIPAFWFLLYYSSGTYSDIRRMKTGKTVVSLFIQTILGTSVIFFALILDDTVISYHTYYNSFSVLFMLQFSLVVLARLAILYYKHSKFRNGADRFKVLILGEAGTRNKFVSENEIWLKKNYFEIVGQVDDDPNPGLLIDSLNVEEVFILSDVVEKKELDGILLQLYRKDIYIRISPEVYTSLKIPLKINEIFNAPLLMLSKEALPAWQRSVKTFIDITLSFLGILLLLPFIFLLALAIKISSPGSLIYSQERIGKNGKVFKIFKFRSMFENSEPNGPQLAGKHDPRITKIGRFMRKRRLDEIPNLINVLRGEMSLVGPRPERQFYIDQILDKAPEYSKLHLAKPGITSWGQVHFGYAGNVDKMILRMKYDLVYIENMSLFADFQILLRTIGIILKGQGV